MSKKLLNILGAILCLLLWIAAGAIILTGVFMYGEDMPLWVPLTTFALSFLWLILVTLLYAANQKPADINQFNDIDKHNI